MISGTFLVTLVMFLNSFTSQYAAAESASAVRVQQQFAPQITNAPLICPLVYTDRDILNIEQDGVVRNNIATIDQLGCLRSVVLQEIYLRRSDAESYAHLNATLTNLQLPRIDVQNATYKLSEIIGFIARDPNDMSPIQGLQIDDPTHTYCLPCTIEHNRFAWGIIRKR